MFSTIDCTIVVSFFPYPLFIYFKVLCACVTSGDLINYVCRYQTQQVTHRCSCCYMLASACEKLEMVVLDEATVRMKLNKAVRDTV